jgi:hypothetical protein
LQLCANTNLTTPLQTLIAEAASKATTTTENNTLSLEQ